ncbi:MAG: hypothetical protein LBS89_08235 [Zoogloeaceae bacterium]|jgi:hypothetical protein|nr:hypothetical protein [Zoogloeaceae bacterium]
MKIFLSVLGLTFALLALVLLIPVPPPAETGDPDNHLPWQIALDATGQSRVFGLEPGISTLAEARQRFGEDLELAIIASQEESGTLEAYYPLVTLGPLQGRLILTLEASPEHLQTMKNRAAKSEYTENVAKKFSLASEDFVAAEQAPIRAISLIPAASLDEATILQRFGEPAEKISASETLTHYLYPSRGLDVVHDAKGKEILQYVAPKNFESQILAPLRTQQQAKATRE